ncbi:hypothetical protein [uncultured Clostridium sp.]|nr:hypothetical protein [uncultured Clostridium sp.]
MYNVPIILCSVPGPFLTFNALAVTFTVSPSLNFGSCEGLLSCKPPL